MNPPKQEIRNFYNATGKLQDSQRFYEVPCLSCILEHVDEKKVTTAVEIGMGTGSFARQLLGNHLPEKAEYIGYDISDTMIELAQKKLAPCRQEVQLERRDVCRGIPLRSNSADAVFANYILDILDEKEVLELINEFNRILKPGGTAYISNICGGSTFLSIATMNMWKFIYKSWPRLVGFCRPLTVENKFRSQRWNVNVYNMRSFSISSQVIVAEKGL